MESEKKRILSFWDTRLPFQVLLLLFSGRVLSTKRSIISHPFLAPTWVDDFPNFPFGGIWMFPKIMVPPNHPLKNRVFHYFHHPFWGETPLFLVQHPYVFVAGKYSHGDRIPIPEMLQAKTSSTVASSWTWDSNASWEDKIPLGPPLAKVVFWSYLELKMK